MSSITSLKLSAGKIRRELDGITNPQAMLYLNAVSKLPDNRMVVVDVVQFNAAKLQGVENEDVLRRTGEDLGSEPESGSGSED